jgi:hypothetical protein
MIRCSRCGRELTDPVSQALRMGPECRGGARPATRRQVRVNNRVLRGVAYAEKTTVKIGQTLVYQYDPKDGSWKSDKSTSTHERFGEWLEQYELVTMPAKHLEALKVQKKSAAEILKASRAILQQDQVKLIRCELARLSEEIVKFSRLSVIHKISRVSKGSKDEKVQQTKNR